MTNNQQRPSLRQSIPTGDVREIHVEVRSQASDDPRAFTVYADGRQREWANAHWDENRQLWWHWLTLGSRVAVWQANPPPSDCA